MPRLSPHCSFVKPMLAPTHCSSIPCMGCTGIVGLVVVPVQKACAAAHSGRDDGQLSSKPPRTPMGTLGLPLCLPKQGDASAWAPASASAHTKQGDEHLVDAWTQKQTSCVSMSRHCKAGFMSACGCQRKPVVRCRRRPHLHAWNWAREPTTLDRIASMSGKSDAPGGQTFCQPGAVQVGTWVERAERHMEEPHT